MYMANLQKLLLKTKRYLGNADARRDNVRNQREHLFLNKLDDRAVDAVKTKFFKNYKNWCKFLGRKHSLSIVTGKNIKPSYGGDDEAFLLKSKNSTGKAAHSDWSNYDDLYEYFWSPDCFYLGWPMRDDGDLSPVSSLQQLFYASSREITITLFLPSILGILDIILNFPGFHRWKFTEILRNILKIAVSLAWCVVLPLCDAQSNSSAPGMLKQWISFLPRDVKGVPPLHILAVALCLLPNVLTAIMFIFPMLRRWIENSDWKIIRLHVWWSQV
ncbi:BnaC06g42430D [Brassica napus]|uniref:BnaC06g42430D protein n=1 Tax=Brassica napus TaxID=3708 RepID=A0A078I894_BRANA|nr:BnaC06g42430D [Brassica napus]